MLPLPTRNALTLFVTAVLLLGTGIVAQSPVLVVWASATIIGLATAMSLTLPMASRLRRERLELAWWHVHDQTLATRGSAVAGVPFDIHVSLRYRGSSRRVFHEIAPALPSFVRCVSGLHEGVPVLGRSRSDFRLSLIADAPGRVVVHGLSVMVEGPFDLFRAPLYFPNPLTIKVLPRALARTLPLPRVQTRSALEASTRASDRQSGGSGDFRELRELVPGDAFKSIAWKASAKAGKLLVRELEADVEDTLYIVLDVSGSMRGGAISTRKLDLGIELAAQAARNALVRGNRVGLITVDGRVITHVPLHAGLHQLGRVHDALLSAVEIVDEDLTDPIDDEIIALVARYIRQQDGVDFTRGARGRGATGGAGIDVDALVRHAASALTHERERTEIKARDRRMRILRRYCQARGLGLRYRRETRALGKASGLAKALRIAAGTTRMPRALLVITDFDDMPNQDALRKTLRLLRAQKHAISFIVPDARKLAAAPNDDRARDLHFVYGLGEERRLREARSDLTRLGIAMTVAPTTRFPASRETQRETPRASAEASA